MGRTLLVFFIECLPLLVLFVAGQFTDFYNAIWWYLGAVIAAIMLVGHIARRFPFLSVVFGLIIIISGTLSNYFKAPDILIFADSLYYLGAAAALMIMNYRGVNLLERLFNPTFGMEKRGWDILLRRWVIVLLLAGISNEIVRVTQTPEFWINFQFYRSVTIFIFANFQFLLTRQYRLVAETNTWGIRTKPSEMPV
jgi:intracellular septation protein A